MRLRTVLSAAVLAGVAALPLAGVASAQPTPTDRDCRDFASQAAAQSALRSRSGDPQRLDANHDGVACEDYFRMAQGTPAELPPAPAELPPAPVEPVTDRDPAPGVVVAPAAAADDAPVRTVPEHQILVKPHGPADTGDGSAAPADPLPAVLLVGGLGATVALGVGRQALRR